MNDRAQFDDPHLEGACAVASLELTIAAPIETPASTTANRL